MQILRFQSSRRALVFGLHVLLVPLGYLLAFNLRFDFSVPALYWAAFLQTVPLLAGLRLLVFAVFRLYNGWWRHTGLHDLVDLVKGVTISTGAFLGALYLTGEVADLPRSIVVLDWAIAILMFGGTRIGVRILREGGVLRLRARTGARTLLVGAGDAADYLLRQVRRSEDVNLLPVGLVDDDPSKLGLQIHGVPVLGTTADLQRLVPALQVEQIVIAIPSATREEMQALVQRCMDVGVEFKIVPSLREVLDGRAKISELRNVQIEDLLGRSPIQLKLDRVEDDLAGKVVLVTGGAGSIGSELARQIAGFGPSRLVLVEQAESPLYFVDLELRRHFPSLDLVPVIADVTDEARLEQIFAEHRPARVFHAAAYKHVPLMERNPMEAVRNNILGTLRVASVASRYGAEKFVLISTDKAVNPSSVMGATKRIAERIVLGWPALRGGRTDFRAVRFGNVLGSEGSVVPLFRKQLAAGGPLTVTHPDVTRYFMTIPEAVQLVLQASALPEAAGHISMLEMGESVRIVDMAENLIRLTGLEPYKDVPIVFTGLRPGEKMHEELMSTVEATVATAVEKIRVVQTDEPDGAALQAGLDRLLATITLGSREDLLPALCNLVPECVPPLRERSHRERALS